MIHGDTAIVQYGIGTFGSRGTAVGGAALYLRAAGPQGQDEEVRRHAAGIRKRHASPAALASTRRPANRCRSPRWRWPRTTPRSCRRTREPGLVATHFWEPPNFTFPFGAHIVVTEVDRETGAIDIKRYVAVDDCGKILNPLIVAGQVHGGVAQGLGQALWEEAVYDDTGQLVTGELTDYAIPQRAVHAVDREQPHGDAVAGESAGREGRRRGRHDRVLARGGELGGRRAVAARRAAHRHAADAAEDLETDPARRPRMIPHEFEYTAPGDAGGSARADRRTASARFWPAA